MNTVLRNLRLNGKHDCVIYFDTIYGAIEKTLFSIRETNPDLQLRKVEGYTLPCSHNDIFSALVKTLDEAESGGLKVAACVFETITSMPGARFPLKGSPNCAKRGEF